MPSKTALAVVYHSSLASLDRCYATVALVIADKPPPSVAGKPAVALS